MADGFLQLQKLIQQTGLRHKVLASNIANVDTPNYRAKDIRFDQVLGNEMAMTTTDPKHVQTAAGSATGQLVNAESQSWADKNNVELDSEVAKMTENALLQQAGVTLLEKKITMYKSALKTST